MDAHNAGALAKAEALYRTALAENPDDLGVSRLLGILLMSRLRYREALEILLETTEKTEWAIPKARASLQAALARMLTSKTNRRQAQLLEDFVAWEASLRRQEVGGDPPLVSVVMAVSPHGAHVAESVLSVARQTYPNIELIVLCPADETRKVVQACLDEVQLPTRFVCLEDSTIPMAFNEGAALAQGSYLAFLDANDRYAPDRIARLVDEIAQREARWGFSLVREASEGKLDDRTSGPADVFRQKQHALLGKTSNSFAFLAGNAAISSGNIFVERAFFQTLGGFRDFVCNHGWDFCLRAVALAEPLVVREPLYFCRDLAGGANIQVQQMERQERDQIVGQCLADTLSGSGCANALAPQSPDNRLLALKWALESGFGHLLPVSTLRELARDLLAEAEASKAGEDTADSRGRKGRTALVVLGMHRSGTSALSRVLNLCGAYLPKNLRPAKLEVNARGFWEPENVIELNDRMLTQLGGAWNKVDFELPEEGGLVEAFIEDARALLATEYGNADTILIKDPRICVLIPLWHRALVAAGYRPVYVVPIRNPLEVAQSLHARGDMGIAEGLKLWQSYMRHVVEFSANCADVAFVRFADLLDDWRGLIVRVAGQLSVPLDCEGRAMEVDAFLEPSLHRQRSSDSDLVAFSHVEDISEVQALYRACLSRCDTPEQNVRRSAEAFVMKQTDPSATVSFVLCIENNAMRDQAMLLCESIRRFGGRHRSAPILAFAPRPGLGVDAETRAKLADLDVLYVDEPLNTLCPEYASANRVFAAAWAEANTDTDFTVVLDSDTVFLAEPAVPLDADVAVRPVDSKGSATAGPGDLFEDYWIMLAELGDISIDRLPYVRTTIGNERIRASYNGGLIVTRRSKGILTRWAELFADSVKQGLRPYRGHNINIHASAGYVGQKVSEYWGSNQAALALAIWNATDRVVHYPDCYNVPLHLVAADGEIDQRWRSQPPVHLHYHWMFGQRHYQISQEIMSQLGVQEEVAIWLGERIPFEPGP